MFNDLEIIYIYILLVLIVAHNLTVCKYLPLFEVFSLLECCYFYIDIGSDIASVLVLIGLVLSDVPFVFQKLSEKDYLLNKPDLLFTNN